MKLIFAGIQGGHEYLNHCLNNSFYGQRVVKDMQLTISSFASF